MSKMRKILQPQYVGKFKCLGPTCEDNCCIGWRVQIDKESYQRYRECPDEELRTKLDKKVTRVRTNPSDANYAKIKLNPDQGCPFLDKERLCAMQRKLGEKCLSITCTTYPRMSNSVNAVLEKSLTMSCPEAARLALLNPNLMEFDEAEEEASIRYNQGTVLNTEDVLKRILPQRYFWELRIFIISLLQNRSYQLWQRLIILGLFCNNVNQLVSEGKVQNIQVLIGNYVNRLELDIFRADLENIPNELTIQMELLKELADERVLSGVNNKRFLECFTEFLHGVRYEAGAKKEEIGSRYAAAYETYYKPFMEQREYILENYLVNYIFKNLFPVQGERHIFDNYVTLIVHYAMIKMLLIGLAGYHKENFGTEHVLKLIQSFAKVIEHNNVYIKRAFNLLKDNDMNTMPYMAILIKN